MKKFIYLLIIVAIGVLGYQFFTKTGLFNQPLSPKDTAGIKINDLTVRVVYNRPSKRNRDVFGALVPFDKVWRTGANEATTFETNHDLSVKGVIENFLFTNNSLKELDTKITIKVAKAKPFVPKSHS